MEGKRKSVYSMYVDKSYDFENSFGSNTRPDSRTLKR